MTTSACRRGGRVVIVEGEGALLAGGGDDGRREDARAEVIVVHHRPRQRAGDPCEQHLVDGVTGLRRPHPHRKFAQDLRGAHMIP
jgi:hypothetical protein